MNNNQLSFIEDSISENKIDNIYNTRETKEYFVKRELAIKEQEKWCNGRVNPKPLEEFYSSCNQISKVVATPTVSYGKKNTLPLHQLLQGDFLWYFLQKTFCVFGESF
ncbi:MAG: hypothetical protein MJ198_02700 [Bacteroidales bacterium]|nr:hypothetical protein [Bacteroidales bacterium]